MARGRKPEVSPVQAEEWLRRYENGERVKDIFQKDHFAEHTVRKYIDEARDRRETVQARTMVYKDALEKHYKDLISTARKLDQMVMSGKHPVIDSDEPLYQALTEHLPKSKIWPLLSERNNLTNENETLRETLKQELKALAESDPSLKSVFRGGEIDLENMSQAMTVVTNSILGGHQEINPFDSLRSEPTDKDELVAAIYGAYPIGTLRPNKMLELAEALESFENRIPTVESYKILSANIRRQAEVKEEIHRLLTVIILKRLVGGRCVYCPF